MNEYLTIKELIASIESLETKKSVAEMQFENMKRIQEDLDTLFDTNVSNDEEFKSLLAEQNQLHIRLGSCKNAIDPYNSQLEEIITKKHPSLKRLKLTANEVVIFQDTYFTVKPLFNEGNERVYNVIDY